MELRDLELFVAIVRSKSFTRAATEHFLTQPAVSLAVRRLEEEMGAALLRRRRGHVTPTEAGSILLRHAIEIVNHRDAVRWDLQRWEGLETGELRLGTTDAVSVYLLPEVYRSFRERYPRLGFRVWVDSSARLANGVKSGELDLAVLTLPVPAEGLVTRVVWVEKLVLVCGKGHALGARSRVSAALLAKEGMIGYPASSVTRGVIDQALRTAGVEPRVAMEMGSPEAMRRLVEVGMGYAVLPERLVAASEPAGRLRTLTLPRFRARRTLGFAHADDRALSPSADAFMAHTFDALSQRAKRPAPGKLHDLER